MHVIYFTYKVSCMREILNLTNDMLLIKKHCMIKGFKGVDFHLCLFIKRLLLLGGFSDETARNYKKRR
jgi:hypothetical protein